MSREDIVPRPTSMAADRRSALLKQYGCGPIAVHGDGQRALRAAPRLRQRRRPDGRRRRASASRRSPARCATSSRSAGCAPRTPTSARTPSASTTCRWSFSSAARWPTTSPTCCSIPSRSKPSSRRTSTGSSLLEAGARRRPGQRRARAAGGLLPRFDGHDAAPGHGLRPALRIRHLQADHPGRLAARAARQLAAPPGPLGGRPPAREGRGQAELLVRGARRDLARRSPASRPA